MRQVNIWEIGNDKTAAIWIERRDGRKTMIGKIKDGLTDVQATQLASVIAKGGKASYEAACAAVKEWQPERPDDEAYAIIRASFNE